VIVRRLSFLAGLGMGYVLGARAGHERYDAIASQARRFADRPVVQEAAGLISAQVTALGRRATDTVLGRRSRDRDAGLPGVVAGHAPRAAGSTATWAAGTTTAGNAAAGSTG